MEEAVKKLQAEISASKNNSYVKLIGEFLISHVQANPAEASKVMVADKTIAKSLDAMKSEAKKKAVHGMAMLTDEEGFEIVLKYFGIEGLPNAAPISAPNVTSSPAASGFDVQLDELLNGL